MSSVAIISMSRTGSIDPVTWWMSAFSKRADYLNNCVDLMNVAEKLIAESSPSLALHQARDIDEFDRCRNDLPEISRAASFPDVRRHADDAEIWLDCAEGEICCMGLPGASDCIEESGLANVG